MEIKIIIPDDKLNDFKKAFKKAVPKAPEHEGMAEVKFFKLWVRQCIFNVYKTGKILIAKETTPPDIDLEIIEVE